MKIDLVWSTPNAEILVSRMARVSNPANQDNIETAPRLIGYLVRHRHWSPFEMANMCLRIETTRDISAQILRHRSFTFQEFSTRYAKTDMAEVPHLRRQDITNRQASHDDLNPMLKAHFEQRIRALFDEINNTYSDMLEADIAKECARRILPMCTPTVLYMNGTLRSWIHYIELRADEATQAEHRYVANTAKRHFIDLFPMISEALGLGI